MAHPGGNPFAPEVSAATHPLLYHRLKPGTRKVYDEAVARFTRWMADSKADATTAEAADALLADYIQRSFDHKDGGVDRAKATMYGLVTHFPALAKRLPLSARLIAGWRRAQPSRSHPPMTWPVTCAVATAMALYGEPRLAAGTVVAFHCLLRAREMLSVRKTDVIDGRDARMDPSTARTEIVIRDAKGGTNQCVHVADPQVLRLLHSLLDSTTGPSEFLFGAGPGGYPAYYRLWRRVCSDLELDPQFVPHSLRHGGATACFLSGVPMADIKSRGRWVRFETAQHYVQTARALIGGARVPAAVATVGQWAAADVARAISLAQSHSVGGGGAQPPAARL